MLPKQNRLSMHEVEYVQKYGKIIRTPSFIIRHAHSNSTACNPGIIKIGSNSTSSKFAVVVSKKVDPSSVGRHKIKRAMYSALQKSGIDFSKHMTYIAITLLLPHTKLLGLTTDTTYNEVIERVRELVN